MARETESEFAVFVREHAAGLLRTAFLLTGEPDYALNLLRTALVRARLAPASARDSAHVRALMVEMLDSAGWTRIWRRARPGLDEVDASENRTGERAERDRLWARVEALPVDQRVVLVARHHDGLTEDETAALTTTDADTVRSRESTALAVLGTEIDHATAGWQPGDVAEAADDRLARLLRDTLAERAAAVEPPADWAARTLHTVHRVRLARAVAPVAVVAVLLLVFAGLDIPGS